MFFRRFLLGLDLQLFAEHDDGGFPSIEQFANVFVDDETDSTPVEPDEPTQEENSDEELTTEPSEPEEAPVEGEPDPFRSVKHKVKFDGQELEVDYDELLNNYSRQSDYTKKMQELSDQRKQFEELGDVNSLKEWVGFQNDLTNNPEFAQYLSEAIDYFNQNQSTFVQNPQQPRFDASQDPYVKQLEERLAKFEENTKQQQVDTAWNSFSEKHPDAVAQRTEIDSLIAKKPGLDFEDAYFLLNKDNLLKQKEEQIVQNNMKKKVAKTQTKQQTVGGGDSAPAGTFDGALSALLNSSSLFSDD